MKERAFLSLALKIVLLLVLSVSAVGQTARTFYVDWSSGSDSNSGTSTATPWKRHPFMTGFSGTYSHVAGDRFIFRGGVTWPTAAFPLSIAVGGSSNSVRDYYGVDQTWFSGASWARPVFDRNGSGALNGASNSTIYITASFLVIDNIEETNFLTANNAGSCTAMLCINGAVDNITVQNMYVHGWTLNGTNDPLDTGGIDENTANSSNILFQNNKVGNNIAAGEGNCSGSAIQGGDIYRNNELYGTPNAMHGVGVEASGNDVHDLCTPVDPAQHGNGIETFHGNVKIFNNKFHNWTAGQDVVVELTNVTVPNQTLWVYNNAIWSVGNTPINIDPDGSASNSLTVIAYNNTMEGGAGNCIRVVFRTGQTLGTLRTRNNHCITSNTGTPRGICTSAYAPDCAPVATWDEDTTTEVLMDPTTAKNQGYSSANGYRPTVATAATVGKGVNLNGSCSGSLSALCQDMLLINRPVTGPWDVGAYKFVSGSLPSPPTALSATVN